MNTPNPLMPQGSLQGQSKGKSNFRIAVFTILAIHVVLICGFLIQGCKREPVQQDTSVIEPTNSTSPDEFQPFNGETSSVQGSVANDPNALPPYDPLPPTGTTTETSVATTVTSAVPTVVDPIPVTPTNLTPADPTASVIPNVGITPPAGETTTHVVVSGDMLSTIARKYKVTVRAIQDANPDVNPNRLQIGQKLTIPAPAVSTSGTSTVAPAAVPETAEFSTYTVKSGDVLERIARDHKTTVRAIKSANNLKTDRINVGQKLKIPKSTNGQ